MDGNIVLDARYPLGETDFRPLISGIAEADPDVLYVTGYYGEAASIVRQVEEAGLDVQIVGVEGFDSPTFLELAGEAANGVVFTTDLNRDSERDMVQQFLEDHREMYDIQGDMVGAHTYDAVRVLAHAIEKSDSTDPQAILDGLRSIEDYETLSGTIHRFTEGREVVRPIGAQIVENMEFHFYWETDDPDIITPPR
jgi:branched-chain amino acid transport system substrate-binding protein